MNNHIPAFERFKWINHKNVEKLLRKYFKPPKVGRKGYDKVTMFLWLMYKQLISDCTYRDLESMTGIHHTTFIKFRRRLEQKNWFELLFSKLVALAKEHVKDFLLLIDSSFVETYSKKSESGSGYSGHKEKNGFKLHSLVDFNTRLPVDQLTTSGNRHDCPFGHKLVNRAPPNLKVKAVSADKGYDSEWLVMDIKQKWKQSKVAIPVRRMKQTGDNTTNIEAKYKDRSNDRSLYKKRTEIERYFSRKKRIFNLAETTERGLTNFTTRCYLTSIMEIFEWIVANDIKIA